MKKTRKFLALLLCAVMMLAVLAACGDSNTTNDGNTPNNGNAPNSGNNENIEKNDGHIEGEAAGGQVDKLVVALTTASVDVSPFAPSTPSVIMKHELYATLFWRPYFGAPIEECKPYIGKSWEQVDEYTYDIELFEGITDSKGNAITADDVVWSYETSATLAQFTDYSQVDSVTALDDTHVRIVLNTTMPGAFSAITTGQQLYIIDKEWYEGASDEEKMNDPATTAGYKVASFTPGAGATLVARDDYWQTDPQYVVGPMVRNVKTIEFKVITEASMRVIALENNEVDLAAISASDLQNFYDTSAGAALDGWNVGIHPGIFTYTMFLNMDSGVSVLADNLELRKAVLYAIDPEQILLATGNTTATGSVLNAWGCPSYDGYSASWNDQDYYSYNPEKAAECLKNAGYEPGEVTLKFMSSSALFTDSVRSVIISQLDAVGIKVENMAVEQALFNNYKNESSQWDIMIDLKATSTGHIGTLYNSCFNPGSFTNGSVCFTHDDTLTDLFYKATNETSAENIKAFGDYLTDNAICYGLYTTDTIFVGQDGILGMVWQNGNPVIPGAFTFAAEYKSVVG